MKRIDHATATAEEKFTEGDPGSEIPATVLTAGWLNAVQEELANVVEKRGVELDAENDEQVHDVLKAWIETLWPNPAVVDGHEMKLDPGDTAKATLHPGGWFNADAGGAWLLFGRIAGLPVGAQLGTLSLRFLNLSGSAKTAKITLRLWSLATHSVRVLLLDEEEASMPTGSPEVNVLMPSAQKVQVNDILELRIEMPDHNTTEEIAFHRARHAYTLPVD